VNDLQCSQLWLVEAVRDGRVVGQERASFERHRSSCTACAQASQAAHSMREQLRALPAGLPDAFTLRRQRRGLLQAFDASLVTAPITRARPRARRIVPAVAFTILAAVGGWRFWRMPEAPSWVEVVAASGATWSEQKANGTDRITLHDGHFQLSIRRPVPTNRVLIALPDGEIEDLGTVLEVWTAGDRTRRVAVKSGAVVLRLRDAPERRLQAGQSWDRASSSEPSPRAPSRSPSERSSVSAEGELDSSNSQASPRPSAPALRAATPRPLGRTRASEKGALRAAERVRQQRSDVAPAPISATAGGEDAAYLRVLQDFQAGRRDGARSAVKEYLAEYPQGFRRLEVLRIQAELAASQ
jgi:hypothetical protein